MVVVASESAFLRNIARSGVAERVTSAGEHLHHFDADPDAGGNAASYTYCVCLYRQAHPIVGINGWRQSFDAALSTSEYSTSSTAPDAHHQSRAIVNRTKSR